MIKWRFQVDGSQFNVLTETDSRMEAWTCLGRAIGLRGTDRSVYNRVHKIKNGTRDVKMVGEPTPSK